MDDTIFLIYFAIFNLS